MIYGYPGAPPVLTDEGFRTHVLFPGGMILAHNLPCVCINSCGFTPGKKDPAILESDNERAARLMTVEPSPAGERLLKRMPFMVRESAGPPDEHEGNP